MRRGGLRGLRGPLPWLGALLALYLAAPVVYFLYRLASTPARGFHNHGLLSAFWISIQGATIATVLVTLFGVPLAYLLARHRGVLSGLVGTLVALPLAVPPVMAGILLIYLVGPYTPIGSFFGGRLTESLTGVVLAQSFVSAPFLVVASRASFAGIDPVLDDVAATLGHGPLSRVLRVAVPVAAPGIRAGMVLTWLRAFGEYGATVVLAYHPSSLNVYTYIQFSSSGLPGTLAPTALAVLIAAVAVALSRLVVVRRRRRRSSPVSVPAARQPAPPVSSPLTFDVTLRLGEFRLAVAHRGASVRLALLGASGAGKSALLRCLAGLYGPAVGPVDYGDRPVRAMPTERRPIGYVAQGFSLFPHLSVWEQLLFGTGSDPAVAAYWLGVLRLDGLERRMPSELSGGQRQRVALAQALTRSPDVLFLDEPFSALDTPVRAELRRELRRLQRTWGVSTVLVTHDPEEAALLADEVIVVADGRALQQGPAPELFDRPSSPAAAESLGVRNVARGVVTAPGRLSGDGVVLPVPTGTLAPGTPVLWRLAPDEVSVVPGPPSAPAGPGIELAATVEDVLWLGTRVEVHLVLPGGAVLEVRRADTGGLEAGAPCTLHVPPGAVRLWAVPAGAEGAPSG